MEEAHTDHLPHKIPSPIAPSEEVPSSKALGQTSVLTGQLPGVNVIRIYFSETSKFKVFSKVNLHQNIVKVPKLQIFVFYLSTIFE